MTRNLFAYTDMAPITFPGYVSINRTPSGDVEVTVRAAPKTSEEGHPLPGDCASFVVPADLWTLGDVA